jgi:alpha-beta hydrolase superfamily lysophospholipase
LWLSPNWAQGHDFTPCWLVMLLQITFPFLLLHGEADRVTDPDISKELYKSAKSFDKEFKLYPLAQ